MRHIMLPQGLAVDDLQYDEQGNLTHFHALNGDYDVEVKDGHWHHTANGESAGNCVEQSYELIEIPDSVAPGYLACIDWAIANHREKVDPLLVQRREEFLGSQ